MNIRFIFLLGVYSALYLVLGFPLYVHSQSPRLHLLPKQINIHADSPFRYSIIDAWTTEDGLPHNTILDFVQTPDGYLWFSSFNGAARFDGKSFRLIRRSNTPLLGSNIVRTLWSDMRGNLWFGAQEGGILCLRKDGTMIRLDSSHGFRDKNIRSWTENRIKGHPKYGTVYFSANQGIYAITYDSLNNTFRVQPENAYTLDASQTAQDILLDKRGGFWFAPRKGLLYRPSERHSESPQRLDTTNGLPSINVESLYEDRTGTIWIGTRKGVCRFTGGKLYKDSALTTTSPVNDFLEDKEGNLWIATDAGLLYWTKSSPKPTLFSLTTEQGLTDNSVYSLVEDHEGNIWIGTYYGGINRLKRVTFSSITPQDGLVNPIVYATLEARDGTMWVATFEGVQRVTPRGTTTYTTANGLFAPSARALAEDSTGNIWVGLYGALHRFAPDGRITTYTSRDGLVDEQIRSICAAHDGTLWIGTSGGMSSLKNGIFTSFTVKTGDLPSNGILGIIQDRAGNIWISTNGGGVMILNPATGAKSYLRAGTELPSDDAFQVTESPTGDEIWIPCNSGLALWRKGTTTIFTTKDGLPDDNVYSVMEDKQGTLWLTCSIGIYSVSKQAVLRSVKDRTKFSCTVYTRSDGLHTNSCTVPGFFCETRNGEFWVPMLKGICIINPTKRIPNLVPPAVYCESVLIDTTLTVFTSTIRTVAVPAGTKHIDFRYTALSLSSPEHNQFRYKLEGVDKDWISSGTRRIAYYTNLPPGAYTFRIIASNNSGIWNDTGDAVTVVVEAFFYQTAWFFGLCGITVMGVGIGTIRFRTWRLKARAAVLEKMVHERTQQLEEHAEEIDHQNQEITRQLEILDQQARDIELVNTTLNEKNIQLLQANYTLEYANEEILRQQDILEAQAADIELANTELQERNVQLQALNQEKNEFLGIATHDLKNPLAAIRMSVSLVQRYYERMTKEDVLERLRAVETSTERMSSIITNLLDINAIESGQFHINPTILDVGELTRRIVEEYRERAQTKNQVLLFTPPPEPATAYADRNVMLEILDNLISNAVKYSPPERNIYVRASVWVDVARIEIQDEGPGLSEEDKTKLFGKFVRLSARPTGGEHSTGLGLSIVKRMIEAMNGRVWCESELGQGATFFVELPRMENITSQPE